MSQSTIRPTRPDETEELVRLADSTGVFKPLEIATLRQLLDELFSDHPEPGHRCNTLLEGEKIVGFEYHGPVAIAEGTWQLYWIAVASPGQTRGRGAKLLRFVEEDVRTAGGRVLFIETSSLPHYERTRQFYLKHGCEKEAVLRDFYAAGDDMIVFRKSLT